MQIPPLLCRNDGGTLDGPPSATDGHFELEFDVAELNADGGRREAQKIHDRPMAGSA